MKLLREICREAQADYARTARRPTERWLSPAEAAQALEEMKNARMIPSPALGSFARLEPLEPLVTVDGSTVYTAAGPVVLRVLG